MKGINIDGASRLVINPMGIEIDNFRTEEAKTQAPAVQEFTYVEPVEFGTGCFGNPNAFNRLQEIMHQRENSEQDIQHEVLVQELPQETGNSLDTNFTLQEGDGGAEPAFC